MGGRDQCVIKQKMRPIIFPNSDKKYFQNNRSNILGNLWSTFNIDFQSNQGAMRIGAKLMLNTSTATQANMGCPVAIKEFDGRVFAIAGTYIYKNTGINTISAFVEDASGGSSGAPNNYASNADMEVFNKELVCTSNITHIYSKASNGSGTGDWSDRYSSLTGTNNKLCYFKKFNRLYFFTGPDTGVSVIGSIPTSWTPVAVSGDYSLSSVDADNGALGTMVATSDSLWIGLFRSASTQNQGAPGVIWQWDGISAQITRQYLLDAPGCLAMTVDNDIPYAMDSNGVLLQYTGSSFEEIGRLPLDLQLLTNAVNGSNVRFIHPNGLIPTKNGTILALINNVVADTNGTIVENLPSGIWEWSKENGFVHKSSFSYSTLSASTNITDFGQNRIATAGALASMNLYSTSPRGTMMAGCTYYTNASATTSAIFTDAPIPTNNATYLEGQKKGYFVTDFREADEIAATWSRLWAVFKKFQTTGDSMIFKYRTSEETPVEGAITWVNTTSFTVLNSVVVVSNYWTSGTGGEVEITRGTGGGSCSHITNAVLAGGTWTVTLDNPVTGVTTGTATARFQKWVKIFPEITYGGTADGSIKSWAQMGISGASDARIQLKGCLTWTGNGEFYKAVIAGNDDIKVTQ